MRTALDTLFGANWSSEERAMRRSRLFALMVAAVLGGLFLLGLPGWAQAAPPPGTVDKRYIVAVDYGNYGGGFNAYCWDPGGGNPTGFYYRTKVREGWIYLVRSWDVRKRRYTYRWVYSWDSQGRMAPYDIVKEYWGFQCLQDRGNY